MEQMNEERPGAVCAKSKAMAHWQAMLRDDVALLMKPGGHHKELLRQAHALHQARLIDCDDLSDLLELADGALAFAVESLLDIDRDE